MVAIPDKKRLLAFRSHLRFHSDYKFSGGGGMVQGGKGLGFRRYIRKP